MVHWQTQPTEICEATVRRRTLSFSHGAVWLWTCTGFEMVTQLWKLSSVNGMLLAHTVVPTIQVQTTVVSDLQYLNYILSGTERVPKRQRFSK